MPNSRATLGKAEGRAAARSVSTKAIAQRGHTSGHTQACLAAAIPPSQRRPHPRVDSAAPLVGGHRSRPAEANAAMRALLRLQRAIATLERGLTAAAAMHTTLCPPRVERPTRSLSACSAAFDVLAAASSLTPRSSSSASDTQPATWPTCASLQLTVRISLAALSACRFGRRRRELPSRSRAGRRPAKMVPPASGWPLPRSSSALAATPAEDWAVRCRSGAQVHGEWPRSCQPSGRSTF